MKKVFRTTPIIVLAILVWQQTLTCSNLDGTASIIYKNQHQVFSNGESARGYVRMNSGFTIKPGATASLDTVVSVSGSIDLRETGEIQLLKDLKLDAGLTWSSGGRIKGRGNALVLTDKLSIPASKVIHFSGDTILDGQGNTLDLAEHAQLFVDDNVTVTLRNLVIRNKRNNVNNACIRCASTRSKLALDNVELAMAHDLDFIQGQLYVHNDVVFSGTSAFIYHSTAPSFIAPSGILKFDIGTTFSFAPTTTTDHLFQLQDRTSALYLNGCTLDTTTSGMRLTKGSLVFDNKVVLSSNTGFSFSTLSTVTSADYGGSSSVIWFLAWSPDGKTLAIVGDSPDPVGGFANTDELRLYRYDGSTLTALTSQNYGARIFCVDWSPDGKFLAIGGFTPVIGGGFANTNQLRVYSFNGSTLTAVASQPYGTRITALGWSKDGKFLAIGGNGPASGGGFANTDELRVYGFDGLTLNAVTSRDYGSEIDNLTWHPDGKTLAIGGSAALAVGGFSNTDELRIYSFNGLTLTPITSQPYGTDMDTVSWSSDGKVLAIGGNGPASGGGFANTDELRLYSFNGTSLVALTSQDYGTDVNCIDWSPDGKTLAIGGRMPGMVGGFSNTDELRLYSFDGSTLTALTSQDYGDRIFSLAWSPDGRSLAIGGDTPVSGGGFANTDQLRIYSISTLTKDFSPQAYSRSIVFGNNNLGSSSNLNIEVLGSAYVTINGIVNDDSA